MDLKAEEIETKKPDEEVTVRASSSDIEHSQHKVKYFNIILTLLALLVMPTYLYGLRIIILLFTAVVTALVFDLIGVYVLLRSKRLRYDYSGIVTALVTVMLMPATVPPWVVAASVAIGLCIAKYPFGGEGKNIFNPAAVGVAFSAICWPQYVLKYPVPFTAYSIFGTEGVQFASSPSAVLHVGGTPKIDYFDILIGKFAGPLGATSIIVLASCMIYLVVRKIISKRVIISSVAVIFAFAVLFPRVSTGRLDSIVYEFSCGAMLFGIIFMTGDPVTTPKTKNGRLFYGAIIGLLVAMFRYFGKVEIDFVYAILLANVFAGSCDRYAEFLKAHFKRKRIEKAALPAYAENTGIQKVGDDNG